MKWKYDNMGSLNLRGDSFVMLGQTLLAFPGFANPVVEREIIWLKKIDRLVGTDESQDKSI